MSSNCMVYGMVWFVCMICTSALRAQEPAGENLASQVQIEQWIGQLGDEAIERRQEATRQLIEAGEPAWRALTALKEKGIEDPERAARVDRILEEIGWIDDPEVRREVEDLISTLKSTRDPKKWNKAMSRLKEMGEPARKKFEKAAKGAGDPKVELGVRKVWGSGKLPTYRVVLKNAGEEGIWIDPNGIQVSEQFSPLWEEEEPTSTPERARQQREHAPAGAGALRNAMAQQPPWVREMLGGRLGGLAGGNRPEHPPFIYLAPGEEFVVEREAVSLSEGTRGKIGTAHVHVDYQPASGETKDEVRRMRDLGRLMQAAAGRRGRRFEDRRKGNPEFEEAIRQAVAGEEKSWPVIQPLLKELRKKKKVEIVPVFEEEKDAAEVGGIRMEASIPETKTEEEEDAKKTLPVRLTWMNVKKEEIHFPDLDRGNRMGLWYAFFDGEGEFVSGGEVKSRIVGADLKRWTTIEPEESLKTEVEIPLPPEASGPLRLVFGYADEGAPSQFQNARIQGAGVDPDNPRLLELMSGVTGTPFGIDAWKGILLSNAVILPGK